MIDARASGVGRLDLGGKRGVTPSCASLLRSTAHVRVLLGGYGSGKTTSAAFALLMHALRSPYRHEYGDSEPVCVVIGKTEKVLRDSSYKVFKQICPDVLIRREWRSPGEWRILLDSGVSVIFRTWSGAVEGITALAVWIDEAHLLNDAQAFANYAARLRDPIYRDKLLLVTGLPEFGWLYDTFGPESGYPDCEVVHASTYDNQYLLPADIERIRAAVPASMASTYLFGQWAKPINAVYYEWDPMVHLLDRPGDRQAPCHLSLDVGERAAALWWQETKEIFRRAPDGTVERKPGRGLHVVDEILPERSSAKQIMREVQARGWVLAPQRSMIFVDPATDRDERDSIAELAPGCQIIRKQKGDDAYRVDEGIRCVNAALRDADGWVRLSVHKGLQRGPRNLITALPRLKRKETDPERVHKDNALDHVGLDAFRYPVAHILPLKGPAFRVAA